MKKNILIYISVLGFMSAYAQEPDTTIQKDSIATEVVEVMTSYKPKVTDSDKIKHKPIIEFTRNIDKKKLDYRFNTMPVASTFVPKGVKMKSMRMGERERLYNNYIALGYGNNTTPYLDAYIHNNITYDQEYGIQLKGIYSKDPVANTPLNSSYYKIGVDAFYKQEQRYLDWLLNLKFDRDYYNWYGLPKHVNLVKDLDVKQTYSNYALSGEVDFKDSFLDKLDLELSYFTDAYSSNELETNLGALLVFPIDYEETQLVNLKFNTNLLIGKFERGYEDLQKKKHKYLTTNLNPFYQFQIGSLKTKIGATGTLLSNFETSKTKFFVYPDVEFTLGVNDNTGVYLGVNGGLENNSYKKLVNANPYISPTLTPIPTDTKYNVYLGLKGILTDAFSYHLQGSYKREDTKALFRANSPQAFLITTIDPLTHNDYLAYQYGNSFNVVYDDVNNFSVLAEVEYVLTDNFNIGLNGMFSHYTLDKEKQAWNLPAIKSELYAKYNTKKWYAGFNLFFIGAKKGMNYRSDLSEEVITMNSYVDLNLNVGYHINSMFTLFVKGSNLTNTTYQHFTNYNSHGIQVIGGLIWKFNMNSYR